MEQQMTVQEMEARFDGEWILVGEPETTEDLEVTTGAARSRDAEEVFADLDRRLGHAR